MRYQLIVFFYFFKSWCAYVFSSRPITKFQYAAYNLFATTFRIPQSERFNTFLVFKKYGNFLKVIFKKNIQKKPFILEENGNIFIYDVFEKSYFDRKKYVNYFSSDVISGGIFKSELYHKNSNIFGFFIFVAATFFLPFLFIGSLLKKDKAPCANIFKEILEAVNLLFLVKQLNVKKMYFFCIYEKDANITTLLLQKFNVHVCKIPSEVPIGIWNKTIIADQLYICNGYQYDELEEFQASIFINSTEFWGPETVFENISKYKKPIETKKLTIGFYSTGAWIRKLENHIDQGFDMEKMEEQVLFAIKDFCRMNSKYTLKIFLHPREKWQKYFKLTSERYAKEFEGINFQIIDSEVKSSNSFELVDFGVAFQSTIVYERLYYGFKIILMPSGTANFPIKSSPINNICATSHNDLIDMINKNISLTNIEFFKKNQIKHFAKYLYN